MSALDKAYEEKVSAQLQQVKAKLDELVARGKGTTAQAEIDVINHLKAKHSEIEKKRQDLKTSGDAKLEQIKAEIEADIAKLRTSLEQATAKRAKSGG